MADLSSATAGAGGVRHATLFYSSLGLPAGWMDRLGPRHASALANRCLSLQEIIITRGRAGRILQFGRDTVFAVFDKASDALSRALEIQRVLLPAGGGSEGAPSPQVRIGLHMGEVLIQEGERVEIVSRHVSRAFRVMELAGPGRVYATAAVVEAGRDFIDLPPGALALEHFGEFYLEDVGATSVCEAADRRLVTPVPPRPGGLNQAESSLMG